MTRPSQQLLPRSRHLPTHWRISLNVAILATAFVVKISAGLTDLMHDVCLLHHGIWSSNDQLNPPDLQAGLERELVNQHTLMEANSGFPIHTEAATPWQQLASEPGHILDPLTLSDLTSAG